MCNECIFLNLKRLHVKSEENNSTTSKVTLLAFNILKILARCTIVMVKTVNVHVRKFPNLDVVFFCSLSPKRHFQIFFFYYSFFLTSTDQSLKYMNPQKNKCFDIPYILGRKEKSFTITFLPVSANLLQS